MEVSLVTDASFCLDTRAAAWAAWADSPRGRFFGGAALPGNPSCNNSAEMMAAFNGIRHGIERGVFADGDFITFQTDSQYVAGRLHPKYESKRQRWRRAHGYPEPEHVVNDANPFGTNRSPRAMFFHLINKHKLRFAVVRSSQGVVLDWVDQKARGWMLEERAARLSVIWETQQRTAKVRA